MDTQLDPKSNRLRYVEGTEDVWSNGGRSADKSVEATRQRMSSQAKSIASIVDGLKK